MPRIEGLLQNSRKGAMTTPELGGVNLESCHKPPIAVVTINLIEPNRRFCLSRV